MSVLIDRKVADQIEHANSTGKTPVVFVHGLWLLPSSWDRWAALFDQAGYASVQPGWPDDADTVGSQRPPGGVRTQDRWAGRQSLRRGDGRAEEEAGHHRAFL